MNNSFIILINDKTYAFLFSMIFNGRMKMLEIVIIRYQLNVLFPIFFLPFSCSALTETYEVNFSKVSLNWDWCFLW